MLQNDLIELKLHNQRFNLTIPNFLKNKINFMCQQLPSTEWSGILFYLPEGAIESENLNINCLDFYPMNIGNSVSTEFEMSPEIIHYMINNPDLSNPNIQIGLIHSHHTMDTFFSGTDLNTLKEEGTKINHFVSLIVNNTGKYNAAITKKCTYKNTIKSTGVYNSYNNLSKTFNSDIVETTTIVEYHYLDIIMENDNENFIELQDRIKELKDIKKNQDILNFPKFTPTTPFSKKSNFLEKLEEIEEKTNSQLAQKFVTQLITGSILVTELKNTTLEDWVSKYMEKLYNSRFPDYTDFEIWVDFYVDYLFANMDTENTFEILSEGINTLESLPKNKYITTFINNITNYLEY